MSDELVNMQYNRTNDTTWMVDIDGRYSNIIRDYLINDGIPEEGVDQILQNAARTLGYCPNPDDDKTCQRTGIVIGKVQSGKTSNFISLTALAFDNGYDVVIVLGGTKKPLVKQNRERIVEYFGDNNDVLVLDTTDFRDQLNEKSIKQFTKKMGKKIVVVALKNSNQIGFITDNMFTNSSLSDEPVLIIDDEGDEASLNTLVNKNKKSSTYKSIEALKQRINRHCFLSVTATPQANLLIDTLDVLSPDFGVLVDPGKGYCGLDVFHSDGKYIKEIPGKEESLLDEGIPDSFISAISMFFVACAINRYRCSSQKKLSMLVHPSHLKADHQKVFNKVNDLIEDWRALSEDKNDIAYQDLKSKLVLAYNEYKKTIVDIPKFDYIEDGIINAIETCGLHIVNGDKVSSGADEIYDFNIYIGGAMLGRGLTLKGLAITYIIRTAKGVSAADTVQQRARWFGYKTKYLDLCRVFAVEKIIKEFQAIRDHEEDLWDTVRETNLQGTRFKDMARIFMLSDNLRMTRANVAKTENFAFSLWNKQREFLSIKQYIDSNNSVIDSFKGSHMVETEKLGEGAPYRLIKNVAFSEVKEQLLDKFIFPDQSKFNNGVIDKLAIIFNRKGIAPKIDVIWMRDGRTSLHDINNGHIPNYMVGRRPKDITKPITYKGDEKQFCRDGIMQLQIHTIEDKITGVVSPTLALYIPKEIIEKLTNLVIPA